MGARVLSLAALVGCATTGSLAPGDKSIVILDADLRQAAAHPQEAATAKRTALVFVSGAVVTTCRDYLARVGAKDDIGDGIANRAVASEYVLCPSLMTIEGGAAAKDGDPFGAGRGDVLARRLDLTSFSSSLRPRLDDTHRVLVDLGPSMTSTPTEASLERPDWIFRLRVVAVGDFDRDGAADWLVWLTDEAKDGNYRDYRTLMVPNVSRPRISHGALTHTLNCHAKRWHHRRR